VCLTLILTSDLLHISKQIVKRLSMSDFPVSEDHEYGNIGTVDSVLGFLELDFWFKFSFP